MNTETKLIRFTPDIGTYECYYPEGYTLNDDNESGIVTITHPDEFHNLTISSYSANADVDENVLLNFLSDIVENYTETSDLRWLQTRGKILCEQTFTKDGVNWIWWAMAENTQIIIASCNSETEIDQKDHLLYRYIINTLSIIS